MTQPGPPYPGQPSQPPYWGQPQQPPPPHPQPPPGHQPPQAPWAPPPQAPPQQPWAQGPWAQGGTQPWAQYPQPQAQYPGPQAQYPGAQPQWPPGMAPVPGPQAGWPQPAPARPNRHRLAKALIPVWSLGFLAFVPFLILAVRQKTAGAWAVFAGYLVAVIAEFALFSGSSGSTASNVGGGLALLLMAGGGMHAWLADPDPDEPVVTGPGNAAAVAHARERMERRTAARELACQNPVMRSELRIGRPDLARSYDDGGLVDVNQVPAWVLSRHLGLTPDEASAVISARDNVGRFVSAAEILQYTSLRPDRFDAIADWMMF